MKKDVIPCISCFTVLFVLLLQFPMVLAVDCGETITADVTLIADMDCDGFESGIVVGADNIRIDCSGKKIKGNMTNGILLNDHNNVVIKNCFIEGWQNGIKMLKGIDNTLAYNTIQGNRNGIVMYYSRRNEIRENLIKSNTNNGLFLGDRSDGNNLHDNDIRLNKRYGILIYESSNNYGTDNSLIIDPTSSLSKAIYQDNSNFVNELEGLCGNNDIFSFTHCYGDNCISSFTSNPYQEDECSDNSECVAMTYDYNCCDEDDICQIGGCRTDDPNRPDECNSDNECIIPPSYMGCQCYGDGCQCIEYQGAENSNCSIEMEATDCDGMHRECNYDGDCVLVAGEGDDTCSNDDECEIPEEHMGCQCYGLNCQCVLFEIPGVSNCTVASQATDCDGMHRECNYDGDCVLVAGEGDDECEDNDECEPVYHTECECYGPDCDCINVQGPGTDMCTIDEPEVSHNIEEFVAFYDDFNDGTFAEWQTMNESGKEQSCNWYIQYGRLREISDACHGMALAPYSSDISSYNITVKAMVSRGFGYGTDGIGVIFGLKDQDNYYKLGWGDPTNQYGTQDSNPEIAKFVNGVKTVLAKETSERVMQNDTWFEIEIIVDSGRTEFWANGVKALTVQESPLLGISGVSSADADSGVYFDNFTITRKNYNNGLSATYFNDYINSDIGDWGLTHVRWNRWDCNFTSRNGALNERSNECRGLLQSPYYSNESDYTIKVRMMSSGDQNNALGVIFGYQNNNNYYSFIWDDPTGWYYVNENPDGTRIPSRKLIKKVNGVETTLAQNVGPEIIMGYNTWKSIEIVSQSGQMAVKVDGTIVMTANEAPKLLISGVYSSDADGLGPVTNGGNWFDNYNVTVKGESQPGGGDSECAGPPVPCKLESASISGSGLTPQVSITTSGDCDDIYIIQIDAKSNDDLCLISHGTSGHVEGIRTEGISIANNAWSGSGNTLVLNAGTCGGKTVTPWKQQPTWSSAALYKMSDGSLVNGVDATGSFAIASSPPPVTPVCTRDGLYNTPVTSSSGGHQYYCDGASDNYRYECRSDGTGYTKGRCESHCGASSSCDYKNPGDSCGNGGTCSNDCYCTGESTCDLLDECDVCMQKYPSDSNGCYYDSECWAYLGYSDVGPPSIYKCLAKGTIWENGACRCARGCSDTDPTNSMSIKGATTGYTNLNGDPIEYGSISDACSSYVVGGEPNMWDTECRFSSIVGFEEARWIDEWCPRSYNCNSEGCFTTQNVCIDGVCVNCYPTDGSRTCSQDSNCNLQSENLFLNYQRGDNSDPVECTRMACSNGHCCPEGQSYENGACKEPCTGVPETCLTFVGGDDYNKVAWSCSSNDNACCTEDSCVLNGRCYKAFGTINSDMCATGANPGGNDNFVSCIPWYYNPWGPTDHYERWTDVDRGLESCELACGLHYVYGGETSGFGEYSVGNEQECCGDDSGENYAQMCPGITGTRKCCNNANDKIDVNGNCVSVCPCTWTNWQDNDNPSGVGDYEQMSCSSGTQKNVECRTVGSHINYADTGEVYTCSTTYPGGYCVNSNQPDGLCLDYEVRLCCG
ncbi:MAG: right-handed parallel beta-helix repeat-containing protein [Candidatus Aenigmarchaeota archaeon]|nr:right-handed parallel beta-helix repeat-containing protein [Candidatus Aenigmarchaeota archaeon]